MVVFVLRYFSQSELTLLFYYCFPYNFATVFQNWVNSIPLKCYWQGETFSCWTFLQIYHGLRAGLNSVKFVLNYIHLTFELFLEIVNDIIFYSKMNIVIFWLNILNCFEMNTCSLYRSTFCRFYFNFLWTFGDIISRASSVMSCPNFHYCRMLLTRHFNQRPFEETMCHALIANGDVVNP